MIAFLLGVVALQRLPELPNTYWAVLLIGLLPLAWFCPRLRVPAMAASGFLWAALYGSFILAPGLDPALEGKDVILEGRVASLPQDVGKGTRFEFNIARMTANGADAPHPGRVRLTWYQSAPVLKAGETWRLRVRLKRPHGFLNPGGLDYEGWLFQRAIRATGYVRGDPENRRIAPAGPFDLDGVRQKLGDAIRLAVGEGANAGTLIALAIGESRRIDEHQWDLLTGTGTNHLVAISGLHIALVAGMAFFAVRRAWAWTGRAALRWPAPKAAALAAIMAATAYAALAGFAIPTQRALIMVITAMSGLVLGRSLAPGRTLAQALLLVLLFDPTAVLSAGFWLSFGAVAVILFSVNGRVAPGGIWWKWGRLQWLVSLGLIPPLLLFFQRVSLVSPLANMVAIPWVSFVVTPLTLLGTALILIIPTLGQWILQLADLATALLWPVLEWFARLPHAQWIQHAPVSWALIAAGFGILLLLMPRGFPARWLGAMFILPVLLVQPPRPAPGSVVFTLLDVGQGLAAVVRTQNHVLVYDTGPRFSALDTGEAVVIPYLREIGAHRIDTLVISHPDNDHGGGAASLFKQMPVDRVFTSEPQAFSAAPVEPRTCDDGQTWSWDGVEFRMLHPPADDVYRGNDRACVLRIATGEFSLLLVGDIEVQAERRLVQEHAGELAAQIVVVPHHGSKTSSTEAFVHAVRPQYALVSAGYRNPFRFPHPKVLNRYQSVDARILDTIHSGAITFRVDPVHGVLPPERYRETARRYWHSQ